MKRLLIALLLASAAGAQTAPTVSLVPFCRIITATDPCSLMLVHVWSANPEVKAFEVTYFFPFDGRDLRVVVIISAQQARYPTPSGVIGVLALNGESANLSSMPTAKALVYE